MFNSVWLVCVTCMVLLSSWCYSVQHAVNPLEYFSWDFLVLYLQNWLGLAEFLPISHPCGAAEFKSSHPSLLCSSWGDPQPCQSLFAPAELPERWGAGAACLLRLIHCALKSRVIRRGNTWLEAVCWPYPMWVLPSKIIMLLFKINSK